LLQGLKYYEIEKLDREAQTDHQITESTPLKTTEKGSLPPSATKIQEVPQMNIPMSFEEY
jgi:hypothetical protein